MAGVGPLDEEDYMAVLEQKREQVAHMQVAAEVAKESAMALEKIQSRIAEIDELAFGGDAARPNDARSGGGGGGRGAGGAGGGAGGADGGSAVRGMGSVGGSLAGILRRGSLTLSGASSSPPSRAVASNTGGGGGGGLAPAAAQHDHPLKLVTIDNEEWVCDGCARRSIDVQVGAMPRYQCIQGCDFDLCGACYAPSAGAAPAPPPLHTQPQQQRPTDGARSSAPPRPSSGSAPATPARSTPSSAKDAGLPRLQSTLSPEDRRRFGLDCEEDDDASKPQQLQPQSQASSRRSGGGGAAVASGSVQGYPARRPDRAAAAQQQQQEQQQGPPPWTTTLSPEDRKRFGLDGPLPLALEERVAEMTPAVALAAGQSAQKGGKAPAGAPSSSMKQKHPEVLWNGPGEPIGDVTMRRTLDQLAAVGATAHLAQLEETEKQLQLLKMRG